MNTNTYPQSEKQKVKKIRNRKKGKSKRNNRMDTIRVMYANINGIKSKIKALENIVDTILPHIICLTETKTESMPIITGYDWTLKKRENKKGGGVAIGIRKEINTEDVPEDLEQTDAEICWRKIITGKKQIYIGAFYGKQEGTNVEQVENEYNQIAAQIIRLKKDGEVILTGDFNAKVRIDNQKCKQETSRNGKLLERMIDITNLKVPSLNPTNGQLWTRENRHNNNEKSVIDYILTTDTIDKNITMMDIDNSATLRLKGRTETDHNTIHFDINNIPTEEATNYWETWKINDNTNWAEFNRTLKEKDKDKIKNYEQLNNALHESLEETVGKARIKPICNHKPQYPRHIRQSQKELRTTKKELINIDKENKAWDETRVSRKEILYREYKNKQQKVKELIEEHQNKYTKEIVNKIIKEGGSNSQTFWKQVKKIKGSTNNNYNIKDETGEEIDDPEKAKEHIAKYFEELYKPWPTTNQQTTEEITKYNQDIQDNNIHPRKVKLKEIKEARRSLKNKKAPGPDNLPNEIITKADDHTLKIYKRVINNIINKKEQIPKQWKEGKIITIYKGKGTKGQMVNERGITLSSNMGKLVERVIANRINKIIQITDNQAGGRKNRATVDHIVTINNIIQRNKATKQPTIICFLDVTKAYDKAWLEAIMYSMHKSGVITGEWQITKELSNNLMAKVQTKYGTTREIQIKDSIKQGGVLSVIQFANLMDQISKNINQQQIGNTQAQNGQRIGSLLWMDDVVLISQNENDMQKMLDITDEVAKMYRIKFGQEKSKIITIGKVKELNLKIGGEKIEATESYKYLGCTISNKNNNKEHIKKSRNKAELAYQTILSIMGNKYFREIEMGVAWKLITSTVIPILTYAGEAMIMTKNDYSELNKKLDNILKRLLLLPQSTPREALYLETGLMDIETTINRNKLLMFNRITCNPNSITEENLRNENQTHWKKEIDQLLTKYEITEEEIINRKRNVVKKIINQKVKRKFFNELILEGIKKKKVYFYLKHAYKNRKDKNKPNSPNHKLSRTQLNTMMATKTRMLDMKTNYRAKYQDTLCRHCGKETETQDHILQECDYTTQNRTIQVKTGELNTHSTTIQRKIIEKIKKIMSLHLTKD